MQSKWKVLSLSTAINSISLIATQADLRIKTNYEPLKNLSHHLCRNTNNEYFLIQSLCHLRGLDTAVMLYGTMNFD